MNKSIYERLIFKQEYIYTKGAKKELYSTHHSRRTATLKTLQDFFKNCPETNSCRARLTSPFCDKKSTLSKNWNGDEVAEGMNNVTMVISTVGMKERCMVNM